jgi:Integrase core domain
MVFVLVHSPVVGPSTRSPVGRELERRGHRAVVPSLLGPAGAPTRDWRHDVEAARAAAYDNAVAESLFASLEKDLLRRRPFPTRAEARTAVFDYIETFYNPIRLHSKLGYLSPVDHEQMEFEERTESSLVTPCPPNRGRSNHPDRFASLGPHLNETLLTASCPRAGASSGACPPSMRPPCRL